MAIDFNAWLRRIVQHTSLHGRWLNTLSYLENCGAKLLAACEHPTLVREEMLKHAAEEFRHAHFLKSQIAKVVPGGIGTYEFRNLLGGYHALHFLTKLNVRVSRLLKNFGFGGVELRGAAYALVSYAIEMRAEKLYPAYQEALLEAKSKVSVRTIILEEAEHLDEMKSAIRGIPNGTALGAQACAIEEQLWNSLSQHVYGLTQNVQP